MVRIESGERIFVWANRPQKNETSLNRKWFELGDLPHKKCAQTTFDSNQSHFSRPAFSFNPFARYLCSFLSSNKMFARVILPIRPISSKNIKENNKPKKIDKKTRLPKCTIEAHTCFFRLHDRGKVGNVPDRHVAKNILPLFEKTAKIGGGPNSPTRRKYVAPAQLYNRHGYEVMTRRERKETPDRPLFIGNYDI
jgi:hypothetical protein